MQENSPSLYSNFILNLYIFYELNDWARNPSNIFTLINCLFGIVKSTRNVDKCKFTYNDQWIAFDGKSIWSYGNGFTRYAVIFSLIILHFLTLIIKKMTF